MIRGLRLPGVQNLAFRSLFVLLLLSAGCASPDTMREKLYDSTRAYNRALRWGDIDRAAEHLPDASVAGFMAQHESVADELVMLDYQTKRLDLDRPRGVARLRLEFRWHHDDDIVVRTTQVEETWQFHGGRWRLVDERRVSGKPLEVFAESEPPSGDAEARVESAHRSQEAEMVAHPYLPGLEAYRTLHSIPDEDPNLLSPQEARARKRAQRQLRRGRSARSRADAAPASPR